MTNKYLLTKKNIMPLCIITAFTALIVFFVCKYKFDWPHWDDFLLLTYYDKIFFKHSFSFYDFLTLRDGVHPFGFVVLFSSILFKIFGIHFSILVWLNFFLIFIVSILTALTVNKHIKNEFSQILLLICIPATMLHPFQVEQLFWPSSIGWYLSSFFLLLNINIIEQTERITIPLLLITLFIATFCSAQGNILWGAAALHLFLRNEKRAIFWPFFFATIAIICCVRLAILPPTHASCTALITYSPLSSFSHFSKYCTALLSFFLGTLGAAFSIRNIQHLYFLGFITSIITFIAILYAVKSKKITPAKRIGIIFIFAGLSSLVMFAVGRLPCGLFWAVFEFHMSPLLVILLTGILIIAAQAFDDFKSKKNILVFLALVPFFYVLVSIIISLPDALNRAKTGQMIRVLGKHSVCTQGYSPYVVELSNSKPGSYSEIMQITQNIRHLCQQRDPASADLFKNIPYLFKVIAAYNPEAKAPLNDLWVVYQTHTDLIYAFPFDSCDTPMQLLRWACAQAKKGSHYAPEILAQHESFLKNFSLD